MNKSDQKIVVDALNEVLSFIGSNYESMTFIRSNNKELDYHVGIMVYGEEALAFELGVLPNNRHGFLIKATKSDYYAFELDKAGSLALDDMMKNIESTFNRKNEGCHTIYSKKHDTSVESLLKSAYAAMSDILEMTNYKAII